MSFDHLTFWLSFVFLVGICKTTNSKATIRKIILLAYSYLFYWMVGGQFIVLLLVSTLVAYLVGKFLEKYKNPIGLFLFLCVFLIPLVYFKIITNTEFWRITRPWDLMIPLGISFYTFQILAYLIDIYKNKTPAENTLMNLALYLAFFPKLIAGPIERPRDFFEKLEMSSQAKTDYLEGIYLVVWGLVKKLVIAEQARTIADMGFNNPSGLSFFLLIAPFAYYLQIYADFSGYTDIALGSASFLGIKLSPNFDKPYFARNASDFWRRWHISLSSWFRDYVYIPLGGSRNSLLITCRNLVLVMILVGLWHGIKINFIIWGAIWGIFLCVNHCLRQMRHRSWLLEKVMVLPFFLLTGITWIFFRSDSLGSLSFYISNLGFAMTDNFSWWHVGLLWLIVIGVEVMHCRMPKSLGLQSAIRLSFLVIAYYALILFAPVEFHAFIYGKF